jgi:hypothetical protein
MSENERAVFKEFYKYHYSSKTIFVDVCIEFCVPSAVLFLARNG